MYTPPKRVHKNEKIAALVESDTTSPVRTRSQTPRRLFQVLKVSIYEQIYLADIYSLHRSCGRHLIHNNQLT